MMANPSVEIQTQVHTLLEVLDQDIAHMQQHLSILESLREGVIKRDENGLTALLDAVRRRQRVVIQQEERRQSIRQTLAATMGFPPQTMTLSVLVGQLSGTLRQKVAEKQRRLQDQVGMLQRQWQLTSQLLQDCARLNRRLFRTLFTQESNQTYGREGMQQGLAQANMVNMHI